MTYEELETAAEMEGVTLSELVRKAASLLFCVMRYKRRGYKLTMIKPGESIEVVI